MHESQLSEDWALLFQVNHGVAGRIESSVQGMIVFLFFLFFFLLFFLELINHSGIGRARLTETTVEKS